MENLKSVQIRPEIIWVALPGTRDNSWDKLSPETWLRIIQAATEWLIEADNKHFDFPGAGKRSLTKSSSRCAPCCCVEICSWSRTPSRPSPTSTRWAGSQNLFSQKTMALMWHSKIFYQENRWVANLRARNTISLYLNPGLQLNLSRNNKKKFTSLPKLCFCIFWPSQAVTPGCELSLFTM